MKMATEPYHYTECGLRDIYLVNGFHFVSTPRGEAVHIEDILGLHRAIGLHLVNERKRLRGDEVRYLRLELNLTQLALGSFLGKDAQTVARWEKGETAISPEADRLIRLLYKEKVAGNPEVCEVLERIAEIEEFIGDEVSSMEWDDKEGWHSGGRELVA